jgi:REP element-mobilizing transposase RayT
MRTKTAAWQSSENLAVVPQHIMRGNNRQATFFAEEDYRFYLERLSDAAGKYRCFIYAYVLMTNHVHLLAMATRSYGLSLMMQYVGGTSCATSTAPTDVAARYGRDGSGQVKEQIEKSLKCAVRPPKRGRPARKQVYV